MTDRIRVTALGLLRRPDGKVLLERAIDRSTGQAFYRALGGGVEFGETATQTLQREFAEELGLAIDVGAQLGVFENIFVYEGKQGHEIVFAHTIAPKDSGFYTIDAPQRIDGSASQLCWRHAREIENEKIPLYPVGFMALLGQA